MEIPFKFDHPQLPILIGNSPARFLTAYNMSHAWASFARNGNTNFDGIPEWPAYTLDKRETMFINAECRVVSDPDREERLLWLNSDCQPEKPDRNPQTMQRSKWQLAIASFIKC